MFNVKVRSKFFISWFYEYNIYIERENFFIKMAIKWQLYLYLDRKILCTLWWFNILNF